MKRTILKYMKPRQGLTFVEVMISIAIFSGVMSFLVYITFLQSLKSNQIATISRAETNVRNVAEFIRYRLIMGRFGSVAITNNGQTITFNDPNNGTAESSFTFNSNTGKLVYDDDTGGGASAYRTFPPTNSSTKLQSVTFNSMNNGSVIEATVTAIATPYYRRGAGTRNVTVEQKMKVYLRN